MSSLGNREIMAKNLKHYISESGKSRKEFAAAMGYSYSTLSEWLNAKKYPRIDRIEEMAHYFGISMEDLIKKETPTVIDDGLSEGKRKLINYAMTVPESKVDMALQALMIVVEVK